MAYREIMTQNDVRPPVLAGSFYQASPAGLGDAVDRYLAGALADHAPAKAVIVPHAGFVYSGPVAGTVYATLRPLAETVRRIVMIGPAHRVPFRGLAATARKTWATPLGEVPVDRAAIDRVARIPGIIVDDAPHEPEHCLEVQLPFLQRIFEDFSIVPLLAGRAAPTLVDRVLAELWGGPETLILISSDLSHFLDHETATARDRAASAAIECLAADRIDDDQACGRVPIKGLLGRARALDLRATTLDRRTSGDTAGTRDRVVGYGGYVFEDAENARLADDHRATLLEAARRVIAESVRRDGSMPRLKLGALAPQLTAARATFVTLKINERLRGCIGSIAPARPLVIDVAENAHKAAFGDPRFTGLSADELPDISLGISILSTPRPILFRSEPDLVEQLRPARDGLILVDGKRRGLFLPQVWESLAEPRRFLAGLKTKAGLPEDYWSDELAIYRFTTESFDSA